MNSETLLKNLLKNATFSLVDLGRFSSPSRGFNIMQAEMIKCERGSGNGVSTLPPIYFQGKASPNSFSNL